jgi:AraC family transcriptional regulator
LTNNSVERISRVCEYISHNLDEELALDNICEVAALSKYHFHRMFSAHMDMSLAKFVLLARLKRASFRLAFQKEKRIIDIAFEAGFESSEAFSRAYKRNFLQSPSSFRAKPNWQQWKKSLEHRVTPIEEVKMQVNIEYFTATKVALLEHLGPSDKIMETVGKFIYWRKESGLSPVKTSDTFGIAYSDPKTTEPEDFRWDVCGSINTDVPGNRYGVKVGEIPGGRCAVIRHIGSHANLEQSIYYFCRQWLPNSDEEVGDFPLFFHYINLMFDVDECDLITDIYFPLRERGRE